MVKGAILYVYYKLDAKQHAVLAPQVESFQRKLLQTWPGLSCQLMQRPETSAEGHETWMEVYQHADVLTPEMLDSIAESALKQGLPIPRMSEVFVPLRRK